MPFIQKVLDNPAIYPVLTSRSNYESLGKFVGFFLSSLEKSLVIVSTDLSHYLSYNEAVKIDTKTSEIICQKDLDKIGEIDACGKTGIAGLISATRNNEWKIDLLEYKNSGDTAGDKSKVVGYGAFAVY